MCDCQIINDWNVTKGCGCYGMSGNNNSLVVQHAITICHASKEIMMKDFSSIKFNTLFMDGDFPFKCNEHMFQMSTAYEKLTKCMENCLHVINSNGGFTVVDWYRCGEISDQTMVEVGNLDESTKNYGKEEISKVDASEVTYHIVSIKPTNHEFMDASKDLYKSLQEKKYKVSDFQEEDE